LGGTYHNVKLKKPNGGHCNVLPPLRLWKWTWIFVIMERIHALFTKIIVVEDEFFWGKFVLRVWYNPFEIIGHSKKTNQSKRAS